jgi:ABC-type glycerol-3-phosphate transport system substrate-binding protein
MKAMMLTAALFVGSCLAMLAVGCGGGEKEGTPASSSSRSEEETMYIYKTEDSKKVEDIAKYANEQTGKGWELMQVVASQDRYVSIYRKPKTD